MMDRMVKTSVKGRPSRLRNVRAYLLGILALTLLFFSSTLASLVRQQTTSREYSLSNLRSGGERIALEMEDRLQRLASDCLHAEQLANLRIGPGDQLSLDKVRELGRLFGGLKKTHAIAADFFLLRDGQLIYPRLFSPRPETIEGLVPAGSSAARVSGCCCPAGA